MTILALDLATSTGYALSTGTSGVVSWRGYSHDYGELDRAFRDWLSDMIVTNGVKLVVVEPPVLRGASSILLVGLYWSAQSVAWLHECRRRDGDSRKVREHILGKPRLAQIRREPAADGLKPKKHVVRKRLKAAVVEAMQARGLNPYNDDEADAQAMLAWATEISA